MDIFEVFTAAHTPALFMKPSQHYTVIGTDVCYSQHTHRQEQAQQKLLRLVHLKLPDDIDWNEGEREVYKSPVTFQRRRISRALMIHRVST